MNKFILIISFLALTLGLFATVSVTGAIVGGDNSTAGLGDGVINLYGVIRIFRHLPIFSLPPYSSIITLK